MLFLNEENKQRFIWGWDWKMARCIYMPDVRCREANRTYKNLF